MFFKNIFVSIAVLVGALLLTSTFHPALAHGDDSVDYGFPFENPLLATFLSATNGLGIKPPVTADIEPMPERENLPLLKKRNKITLGLFLQNHPAPLAFIITGAGSNALGGSAFVLASQLQKLGYSAVTLPDPVSWTYVVGRSRTALPGYMPRDADEYYNFLQQVTAYLTTEQHVQISNYSLVGYSYGGLLSAYLADVDSRQHTFNFTKVVVINPAIDIQYALKTLDGYYADGDRLSPQRKQYLTGGIESIASDLIDNHGFNEQTIMGGVQHLQISKTDLEWLIGASFRNDLKDVIFVSQQVNDLGILKIPANSSHMNAREDEAASFSFAQYMNQFVLPSVEQEYFSQGGSTDIQQILKSTSLYKLAGLLKSNPHVYVMENRDDLLIKAGDIDFLKTQLGDRLYLYPHGGHVGNLAYPKNLQDLAAIMSKAD